LLTLDNNVREISFAVRLDFRRGRFTVIARGANAAKDRDVPIYSYEELRKVSDDDLINAYDMKAAKAEVGLNYYLDELRR